MLSRVADNLYWMSRYLERIEQTIMLLDINLNYTLDQSAEAAKQRWDRLCNSLLIDEHQVEATSAAVTRWLISDRENFGSIVSMIGASRFNAQQIRQQLSTEVWTKVNKLYHYINKAVDRNQIIPVVFLTEILESIHLIRRYIDVTMVHQEPWHYLQLGQHIEAGLLRTSLLGEYVSFRASHRDWVIVLRTCSSLEAYCAEHTADIQSDKIIDFLLLNERSPQSVRYSVENLYKSLKQIEKLSGIESAPQRLAGRLLCQVSHITVDELYVQQEEDLTTYFSTIRDHFEKLHYAIYRTYIHSEELA